jgi:hypothetical protein
MNHRYNNIWINFMKNEEVTLRNGALPRPMAFTSSCVIENGAGSLIQMER